MKKILNKNNIIIFILFIINILSSLAFAEDKAQMIMNNAISYSKKQNHTMAIALSEQSLKLRPYDLSLIYQSASVWGRAGNYAKAIQDLSMVIREDEMNSKLRFPSARKYRAECYASIGNMQKAVEDYNFMLRRNPNSGKIWYYLAETLAVMGRYDWAIQAIDRGRTTDSHWVTKLDDLKKNILSGKKIVLHAPFSN